MQHDEDERDATTKHPIPCPTPFNRDPTAPSARALSLPFLQVQIPHRLATLEPTDPILNLCLTQTHVRE